MDKIMVDIRNENDIIVNLFQGEDLITIDDLLNKIVELQENIDDLQNEIDELKENNDYEPDPYDVLMDRKIEKEWR